MSSKKNIIIGPAFPLRGGLATFNQRLCQAFLDIGVDSKILSFSLQYPSFLFPGKTQFDEGEQPKKIIIKSVINSINPFNWLRISKIIRKEKPDYIIIRYWLPFMAPCLGTISRLVKWGTGIKVLAITDNIIPHEKRIGDFLLTSYFVKSCDGFITLSRSVLDDLSNFTNCLNKQFVPHPIYDVFGKKISKKKALELLGLNFEDKHLLFFGFVRRYKGLDIILRSLKDERLKDVKLVVAGEFYDDFQEYYDLIAELGIQEKVIFKSDFIPSEEVKNYFCAADMVVQTYRSATQSGVTQIAYHFERPMLVTDVGGLAEIISDGNVGYVTAVNSLAVSDAIVDFYSNNREAKFTENIKEEKKRFSWEKLVQTIEGMI